MGGQPGGPFSPTIITTPRFIFPNPPDQDNNYSIGKFPRPSPSISESSDRGLENFGTHDKDRLYDFLRGVGRIRGQMSPEVIEFIRSLSSKFGTETMLEVEELGGSLTRFIGHTMYLSADPCIYQRVEVELGQLFSKTNEKFLYTGDGPSDLEDYIRYRPLEIIGSKCTQIFVAICLGKIPEAFIHLRTLRNILCHPILCELHQEQMIGFLFVGRTLEKFLKLVIGCSESLGDVWILPKEFVGSDGDGVVRKVKVPVLFNDLQCPGKGAVNGLRFYFGDLFHIGHQKKIHIARAILDHQQDCVENFLMIAETTRKIRRSAPHAQNRIDPDEFEWIGEAFKLNPSNPFVMLLLMDGIVDMLRDGRGSFTCGTSVFSSTSHEAVCWMKRQARKLFDEHPKCKRILSRISDYFARYVPLQYFDVKFAEALLVRVYELDPTNPVTCQRLGIFHRMSKGNLEKSLTWFEKAIELDPSYFNAFLECVKNWIRHLDEKNVAEIISKKLGSPASCAWTKNEVMELRFYKGIVHFVRKEWDQMWAEFEFVAYYGPKLLSTYLNLAETIAWYHWDQTKITLCKLRSQIRQLGSQLPTDKPTYYELYGSQRLMGKSVFNLLVGLEKPRIDSSPQFLPTSCPSRVYRLEFTQDQEEPKKTKPKDNDEAIKELYSKVGRLTGGK